MDIDAILASHFPSLDVWRRRGVHEATSRPWPGSSVGFQFDKEFVDLISVFAGGLLPGYGFGRQMRAVAEQRGYN